MKNLESIVNKQVETSIKNSNKKTTLNRVIYGFFATSLVISGLSTVTNSGKMHYDNFQKFKKEIFPQKYVENIYCRNLDPRTYCIKNSSSIQHKK